MDERIIKYFSGELTGEERLTLLEEADVNPELKNNMLNYQNVNAILSLSPKDIQKEQGIEGYKHLTNLRRQKQVIHRLKWAVSYAAVISLFIIPTWYIAQMISQPTGQSVSYQQELLVPAGQRARISLPDGTVAWVNAGSTLLYPSVFGKERKVSLTGEAYFDVVANPDSPFIVSTETVDIKALGTQFNVYSYPKADYMSTTLIHGSIKVYKTGDEENAVLLTPNQHLFYENGQFRLTTSIDKDDLLWKEGIYSFKKERLDVIIRKLELYYDVDIIIQDTHILRHEYTGKFRQRDGVIEILRIIQKIYPFKISQNEELNQITLSR
jgi:ferric-dicitrate binding protein FerR (iron transport regulator)